jgi:hypothetical protein
MKNASIVGDDLGVAEQEMAVRNLTRRRQRDAHALALPSNHQVE